jgi:hypothetical protein
MIRVTSLDLLTTNGWVAAGGGDAGESNVASVVDAVRAGVGGGFWRG